MAENQIYKTLIGLSLSAAAAAIVPGCLDRPLEPIEPRTTTTLSGTVPQSRVDKIDLLFTIDDSASMADKQKILATTIADLVDGLVNPACLDEAGSIVHKPKTPEESCPDGSQRPFDPVSDIHVGIISSSLGTPGSEACANKNDGARLLARLPDGTLLPTAQNGMGFLAWAPDVADLQPGQFKDASNLSAAIENLVLGVGQQGCGYEAQLESVYRFLVEPEPYATIAYDAATGRTSGQGVDTDLLEQRAAFLRPDSLVAVVMLSDENDCSYRAEGIGWNTTQLSSNGSAIRARKECATSPNGICCTPCGYAPEECAPDPSCSGPKPLDTLQSNLSCFQQKRRYGIDLLQPTERYVRALSEDRIVGRNGDVQDNPLFRSPAGVRRSDGMVFMAGIVGVPWQLIARDATDATQGLQNATELNEKGTWDKILGHPEAFVPPSDSHMVESIYPRAGLAGTQAPVDADSIHGHEFEVDLSQRRGELQYACTFELPEPIDCSLQSTANCDCNSPALINSPLCQSATGAQTSTQYRAKAFPGLRQLSVLKKMGEQGIVGSICPAQMSDAAAPDYGYRLAMGEIVNRLGKKLKGPCLSRTLTPKANGQVACTLVEGRQAKADDCPCAQGDNPEQGRSIVSNLGALAMASQSVVSQELGLNCFCAIDQLDGEALTACQNSPDLNISTSEGPADGWCYVSASSFPKVGNEELVAHCPENERQTIRFVGKGQPVVNSYVFYSCSEEK